MRRWVKLTRFDGGQIVPEETHENSHKKVLGELIRRAAARNAAGTGLDLNLSRMTAGSRIPGTRRSYPVTGGHEGTGT
jgi:hypothetical protein